MIDLEEPLSEELFAAPLPSGSAPGSASAPGHATSVVAREAAVPVLRQAAEAMTAAVDAQDQVIELKLRPEELGQLRFRIGQGETGLMLSVTADRPETLDLLRRNVDQLARHLSDLGYGSASFSFGEERPGSQSRSSRESAAQGPDPIGGQVTEAAVSDPVARASDGLDMRL
ncbi:flagellar hook-length control protein FliK [Salipiger bermudensis]|uniref:flagellar hook-length control protein FliK n=1 Tax=Salipiger bermudensis TaxID=344736 RepID=UPI001C310B31|nr:flagellar hook-length control protein FliK [Salipiger bermudensis]